MKSIQEVCKYLVQTGLNDKERFKRLKSKETKESIVAFVNDDVSYTGLLYKVDERWPSGGDTVLYTNNIAAEDRGEHDEKLESIFVCVYPKSLDLKYLQDRVIADSINAARLLNMDTISSVVIFCGGVDKDNTRFMDDYLTFTEAWAKYEVLCNLWAKKCYVFY